MRWVLHLIPKGDVFMESPPFKAEGSWREWGERDSEGQRKYRTAMNRCSLNVTRLSHT